MTDLNQSLLKKMESHILANLKNEQFGVQKLAQMMAISRSHLHRKLHKINGKSISRFIREYRLDIAGRVNDQKQQSQRHNSGCVASFASRPDNARA